uniref:Secreted venom protein family 5 protein n=1 Tax=Pristhesancus plagipennis TaxID=1955184 RepID=A0A2K8JSY4_PRIPG|nr:secreted venom protein family 5 protein [Pristhesancus plagipennis]
MLKLLLFTLLLSYCTADTVVLNQLMDQVLDSLRTVINQAGMNEIHTPDADYEWPFKWHFVKITGHVNCRNGVARALASIRRTGDTTMTTQGNKATIRTRIGLGELGFYFGSCQLEAKHLFSYTHDIKGTVASNSIDLQISLTGQGPQCVASLDHVVLDQFGGLRVDTGGGPVHRIEDRLIEWLSRYFHDQIVAAVNTALADSVTKALPKVDLCSKIPH